MATSNCIHSNIFALPIQERCLFVQENCPYEYFNFYQMHFCFFKGHYLLTLPTCLLLMLIFFFILSETSELNLSSSLTKLVNKLGISQNIAAVTLLALGNGAADVISSLVASTQNEGIELALGSLLGSCLFVTSCAFGIIIYSNIEIKANPQALNRDIGLFICSLLFFLYIFIKGSITIYQSITFFGLYIVNILMAFYQDWNSKKRKGIKRRVSSKSSSIERSNYKKDINNTNIKSNTPSEVRKSDLMLDLESCYQAPVNYDNDKDKPQIYNNSVVNSLYDTDDTKSDDDNNNTNCNNSNKSFKEKEDEYSLKHYCKHDQIDKTSKDTLISIPLTSQNCNDKSSHKKILNPFEFAFDLFKQHYLKHKEKNWESIKFIAKVFYLLFDFPFVFLRSLTIPPCELKYWNKTKFVFMPLCDLLFITIVFKLYRNISNNLWYYLSLVALTLIIGIILSITTKPTIMPNKIVLLSILSFIMSLIWIWFIANNLISILKLLGLLLGLIDSFLGMTMLTFGNSICDIALNIALVKNGYAEMALTGALAGPLFNFLIGLGSTLVKQNLSNGIIYIDAHSIDSVIIIISIIGMILNLGRIAIQARIVDYRLNRKVAYIGWMCYGSFLVVISYIAFRP